MMAPPPHARGGHGHRPESGMNGSRIFINYRREDTSGESGRLFDHLVDRYGASRVFRDIDRSIPGAPFPDAVDSAVRGSSVVLVVIGRRWLEELRARATRSDDYVLMEIRTALEQNVRIIPVLIDSTPMPKPDLLPQDIRQLSGFGIGVLSISTGMIRTFCSRAVRISIR